MKTVLLGQVLSLFICGTAVTSQYLAEVFKVKTPMLQSFINYFLLLLVYTTMLAFRTGMWNMGWEILVHLFFLSTFSFQNLKMKTSILILKFLLYSNTWKFIPRIKCAFNLMLCHICLEFCALWFEVICYIRKNKLYSNTLICQRLCSIPPTLINLLFRKLWSSCILLHVEEFLCFSPFALSPPRLCFLLFYLK